jgi:hypothetical protein
MRRLVRSSWVAAAALIAATWAVCELIGLGAGISLALAGVVTVSVVPWLVFRASRRSQVPSRLPGWDVRPAGAEGFGAQPRAVLERPARHTGDARAPQRARTLVTQYIRIAIDDAGFEVKKRRKTAVADDWEDYLRMQWSAVAAMKFATDRHDPIVALYVWTAFGKRHHVADSRFLSQPEWVQLSKLIAESTRGKLTLDLAGRDNPSTLPDS